MNDIIEDRIVRVPIKTIEKPRAGILEGILENWWIIDPKTESVVFYQRHKREYSSAQCNSNEDIVRRVIHPIWQPFGFEVRLIPVAFVPVWMAGDVDFGYSLKALLREKKDDGPKVK